MAKGRVGIDARKLRDFGIGTYIRNILVELHRHDAETPYVVLSRNRDLHALRDLVPRFQVVVEDAEPYSLSEQVRIPWRLRREGVTLVHEPHYVLPPLTTCRSVVTIHDCIHLMFPQYLPNRLAHLYARSFMWTATHQAARILTVSEASKRDILRFFAIPEKKVQVIYNAIDERFLRRPTRRRPSGYASAISSTTRSCSTSATSSRTRTSSGSSMPSAAPGRTAPRV